MGDNLAGGVKRETLYRIHHVLFPIYIILLISGMIICILFWPGVWDSGDYIYGSQTCCINPLSIIFGVLGVAIKRSYRFFAFPTKRANHDLGPWSYCEPFMGAVSGLLSLLMMHVVVDRLVSSPYVLDPIAISVISFISGYNQNKLWNLLQRKIPFQT